MQHNAQRTVCWSPTWARDELGLEHVVVKADTADSSLLVVDDHAQMLRLTYRLQWDEQHRLRTADLAVTDAHGHRSLSLRADGEGHWHTAQGEPLRHLDGCLDIDIWPTPLTNSFPIWRSALGIGERRTYRMAWVSAPSLDVVAKPQAYTRLGERLYRFESLDGTGFTATLHVDDAGFIIDYPGLFRRVHLASSGALAGA